VARSHRRWWQSRQHHTQLKHQQWRLRSSLEECGGLGSFASGAKTFVLKFHAYEPMPTGKSGAKPRRQNRTVLAPGFSNWTFFFLRWLFGRRGEDCQIPSKAANLNFYFKYHLPQHWWRCSKHTYAVLSTNSACPRDRTLSMTDQAVTRDREPRTASGSLNYRR